MGAIRIAARLHYHFRLRFATPDRSAGKIYELQYSGNRRAVNKKTAGANAAGCCVFLPLQELKESIYRADEMLLADKLRPACILRLVLSGLLLLKLFFEFLDSLGQL